MPVVSLSILWTVYGSIPLNSFVYLKISKIFFFDLVPDWTAMPAGLFITAKFSLFSIKILVDFSKSFFVAIYLMFILLILLDVKFRLCKVTISLFWSLYELYSFLPLTVMFPFLKFFSIKDWGTLEIFLLNHLSSLESTESFSIR